MPVVTKEKVEKKIRGVFERPKKSGIWWISYQRGTVRKREKIGRKSDAINAYRDRKVALLAGAKLPPNIKLSQVTFGTLADAIADYSKAHHKDTAGVTQRMTRLKKDFGSRVANEITPEEIDAWLTGNTKTPATANRYRAAFSLVYREAIRNQKVSANPAKLVRQRRENNERMRFLTPAEEEKLRAAITELFPEHLGELVISLKTGMRLSEQYELTWNRVDMIQKKIKLADTKNGMPREIPMSPEVYTAFEELRAAEPIPGNRVFRLKQPRKWFAAAMKAAGLVEYRWHDNRHTFCSRLAEQKASTSTIQKLAGHKTIAMSARYTHMADTTLAAEIDKLG